MAPRALGIEDALTRCEIGRSGSWPRLRERDGREQQRQAAGMYEDADPSTHAADYKAASRLAAIAASEIAEKSQKQGVLRGKNGAEIQHDAVVLDPSDDRRRLLTQPCLE